MISHPDRIRSELLVLRFRRGDDEAFEELVGIWEKPLFYYIRRLVKTEEDAWDVLQEVWLRVFRKINQLRKTESLPAWLYRIARNSAFNYCRANPTMDALPEVETSLLEKEDAAGTDFSAADAAAIHHGLAQLPLAQREALTLYFLEEFTLNEISSITGVSVGTVKSRLHYAKRALREIMEREGFGHE